LGRYAASRHQGKGLLQFASQEAVKRLEWYATDIGEDTFTLRSSLGTERKDFMIRYLKLTLILSRLPPPSLGLRAA
jgi:hypothetical protein